MFEEIRHFGLTQTAKLWLKFVKDKQSRCPFLFPLSDPGLRCTGGNKHVEIVLCFSLFRHTNLSSAFIHESFNRIFAAALKRLSVILICRLSPGFSRQNLGESPHSFILPAGGRDTSGCKNAHTEGSETTITRLKHYHRGTNKTQIYTKL